MKPDQFKLNPRWNDLELVTEFAAREPDHRLRRIVERLDDPQSLRFLDLGCAAGRNALFLAERNIEVHATDLSQPMVEETIRRLKNVVGNLAEKRVHLLPMTDLGIFSDSFFDFLIALGIHQQAASLEEWDLAVRESARVVRSDGLMLVAHFGVGTDLTGHSGNALAGPHLYEIREGHPSVLFAADELDARLADHGFEAIEPTETVTRPHEGGGQRVTLNGFYRKARSVRMN